MMGDKLILFYVLSGDVLLFYDYDYDYHHA